MKSIVDMHLALISLRVDIKLCLAYAKQAHANKEYRAWSFWLQRTNVKTRDLRTVAIWLHIALHARGATLVPPRLTLREESSTVADLVAVVARTAPISAHSYPML